MRKQLFAGPSIGSVPIVTGKLVDSGNGVFVGTNVICLGRSFAAANTAYDFPHRLGRVPTTVRAYLGLAGGVPYATTADRTFWTVSSIRLRSTVIDTLDFEVL